MNATLHTAPGQQINPDNLTLSFTTRFDSPIRYYDDGYGPLWIMRDSLGIVGIVRCQSWEDAYSIVEDEFLPVVAPDHVHEAYGFNTPDELAALDAGQNPCELIEGYSYQSNSTGTGIVSHDLNGEALDPLTTELAERLEIKITFNFATE